MRRLFLIVFSAMLIMAGVATRRSIAQSPAAIDHYRLLPRLSTLHQSGGFAGFDLDYWLLGDYGFATGASPSPSPTPGAKFVNPEIWGSPISNGLTPAYVIDVDEILNLAGLQGKRLPVASLFDVYQFQGRTSDGSSINLYASLLGPWMYLRGATQPPPGSADYFEYQLKVLARKGPFADANADGVVDAGDYVSLRKTAIAGGADATISASAADWRAQYGDTIPDLNAMDAVISAAAGSSLSASNVPEPASWLLLTVAGSLSSIRHRRRRASTNIQI
jgi:hypothetical protein